MGTLKQKFGGGERLNEICKMSLLVVERITTMVEKTIEGTVNRQLNDPATF